ncbi:MAG: hypothetical protein KBT87_03895 [Gammaproteobacteria bacterium]|jgi:hypothetical protein|nr:hypothetical protein [Gammaproteobacteria bacterium]MBQ0773796.1 hypothetical protein [Gammaproteobacteria bacterium]|tara:strand:- start:27734 stop:27952 length:219 start_codon:yes stop_codon:yes gene_type:complete
MNDFMVGERVRITAEFPNMPEFLREHMSLGHIAEVIRYSNPGKTNRVLVRFEQTDPLFGIYWLRPTVLATVN